MLTAQSSNVFRLTDETVVHFIGIGGIGMSGLARLLAEKGVTVTGSDARSNAQTEALNRIGVSTFVGHQASHVPERAIVVASTAIANDNPELVIAQSRGQVVLHRSGLLKQILRSDVFPHQLTIGVSGSHGKTSTTGMIATALHGLGLTPTAIAGGLFPEMLATPLTNAIGGQQVAVAELDESDGTLTTYAPDISVLLNLEMDHAEHFPGGLAELAGSIQQFIQGLAKAKVPGVEAAEGATSPTLIANVACPNLAPLLSDVPNNVTLIGFDWWQDSDQPAYHLRDVHAHQPGCYSATLCTPTGEVLTSLAMSSPGKHQLGNGAVAILIAYLVGQQLGLATKGVANAAENLHRFTGMGRRFERVGSYQGAQLIDDYAHHPTEITAMLGVARQLATGKVVAIFEPHRYSRLQQFWQEFQDSLLEADEIWVTDIYEASESPRPGITTEAFIADCQKAYPNKVIRPLPKNEWDGFAQKLRHVSNGDVVMSLGAGAVTGLLRNLKTPVGAEG